MGRRNKFHDVKFLPWLPMPSRIATFTEDAQLWNPARPEPSECCSLRFTLWVAHFNSQATNQTFSVKKNERHHACKDAFAWWS